MDLIFLSYFPVIAGLCLLALMTYVNNPTARVNRLFALFSVLIALWLLTLFFADTANTDAKALWSLRLALVVSPAASFAFLLLSDSFPTAKLRRLKSRTVAILAVINVIFMALSLTDLVVGGISRTDSGVTLESLTFIYTLHTILLIGQIIGGVVLIIKRRKAVSAAQRTQIRFFSYGAVIAVLIAFIPGFIFVAFDVESRLTALLTSLSFFVFALSIMIAITRHNLFNIRNVVARAVAYVLSALVVAAVYGLLVGVVIERNVDTRALSVVLTGVSALVVVIVFGQVKGVFDRITNRIFYREAYSSRQKLDELTHELVSHIELDELMNDSSAVIKSALKPQSLSIIVFSGRDSKVFSKQRTLEKTLLDKLTSSTNRGYIPVYDLEEEKAAQLRKENVELVVPIRASNATEGAIVLGPRSSGEAYSRQDLSFLIIAARNIGMAVSNAKSYQEIADFNKTLSAKVRRATSELRTKNDELERLHKTKDDFISMASHQLRPKITASQGFLDLLDKSDSHKTKEQAELLQLASQGIKRMGDIVVDMLDISRMDADQIVLEYSEQPIDIVEMVANEVSTVAGKEKASRFELRVKPKDAQPQMRVDRVKLREVISNLLRNADQYSSKDTAVTVEVSHRTDSVQVLVSDKGIGMTQAEQKKLFEKFYRAEAAKKLRPTGTGIGLYMSKQVVEAHGGQMLVKSTKGKGSSIGFTLPLK